MHFLGNIALLVFSPVLFVCQMITAAAMFGLICLGVTVWAPIAMAAGGEWSLWDALICYAVIIVSVFVSNWLHESCDEGLVATVGGSIWAIGALVLLFASSILQTLPS